jgi:hypothetical protein
MSGILHMVMGGISVATYAVTPGNTGTGAGYRSSGTGSLAPTALNGITIERIENTTVPEQFIVRLAGVVPQSTLQSVTVTNGVGDPGIFQSASATFSTPGGTSSQWLWTQTQTGASPIVLGAGQARSVLIQR